jgi:hypothetical protein
MRKKCGAGNAIFDFNSMRWRLYWLRVAALKMLLKANRHLCSDYIRVLEDACVLFSMADVGQAWQKELTASPTIVALGWAVR